MHPKNTFRVSLRMGLLAALALAVIAAVLVGLNVSDSGATLQKSVSVGGNQVTAARVPQPAGFTVGPAGACYTLTWAVPAGADGVTISRSNDSGSTWTQIAKVAAPTTTYQDCTPGTNATYSIVGYAAGWVSGTPGSGQSSGAPVATAPPLLPTTTGCIQILGRYGWTNPAGESGSSPLFDGSLSGGYVFMENQDQGLQRYSTRYWTINTGATGSAGTWVAWRSETTTGWTAGNTCDTNGNLIPFTTPTYAVGMMNCFTGSTCVMGNTYWYSNRVQVLPSGMVNCVTGTSCQMGNTAWTNNQVQVTDTGMLNCVTGSTCRMGSTSWYSNRVQVLPSGMVNCVGGATQCMMGNTAWYSNRVTIVR